MAETNDIVAKNLEAYPDVAADIINVWMRQKEQDVQQEQREVRQKKQDTQQECGVRQEEIFPAPTETIYQEKDGMRSQQGGVWQREQDTQQECGVRQKEIFPAPTETIYQGNDSLRNQLEDVSKYEMVDGKIKAQYLFANQTSVDNGMLLRKASYTGAAYREQYDGKTAGIYPVMELILYWGKQHWNSSRDMRELFQKEDIPQNKLDYIDNIKLHVWEMRYLPKEMRERFTSDMRIVVDFLAEGNSYRTNQKVIHKEALIKMLRVLSGEENVEDTIAMMEKFDIKEEDNITMCELFDQYFRKGISQGMSEGISQGINQGISQGISQGITRGIEALVITCKELGADFEETSEKLRIRFQLTDEEAQLKMKLYW